MSEVPHSGPGPIECAPQVGSFAPPEAERNASPSLDAARASVVLHRLFRTLFLRGHSARGLQKDKSPKSVGSKLAAVLLMYGLLGGMSLFLVDQSILALAVFQHAMTFFLLGVFIAASAGEVLFNPQEADILIYRPIDPRVLLWAKVRVLVEVSLWVAGSFNAVAMFVGTFASKGNHTFAIVHGASILLEALFCAGCVVLVYQLCLRWFGRERLENLMTTAQVVLTVSMVLVGQLLPRVMTRVEKSTIHTVSSWWMWVIPPAWFAGMDDALAGTGATRSWIMAACAVAATAGVLWGSFGRLARDYEKGVQRIAERPVSVTRRRRRIPFSMLADYPPLRWLLRDPVERSSFLLIAAYLTRDRDVKLRFYPGVAPMLVLPIFMLLPGRAGDARGLGEFSSSFVASFLAMTPLLTINILQHSQQWAASDVFRTAPLTGPAKICAGARLAVLVMVVTPMVILYAVLLYLLAPQSSRMLLLLPGLISLPGFALLPNLGGRAVPLSRPPEEAKSASRGLEMVGGMVASLALAGIATACWTLNVFLPFLVIEVGLMALVYTLWRRSIERASWEAVQ